MSKRSEYQEKTEKIIAEAEEKGIRPKLLIHACCAPCSSYVLEYLSRYFDITVLYYNPNISPEEEYIRRSSELQRLIGCMEEAKDVKLMVGTYANETFEKAVKGLEKEPEGGKRCRICFELRLDETAKTAAEKGFDYFTTTLTISPHKNAPLLNEIGSRLAEQYKVRWLPSDFKKKGGFLRSIELSEKYDLYRQNYCGCVYSERETQMMKTVFRKESAAYNSAGT